ncbi:MAG: bifunctional 23S rRNA (guanine(2069)-N(7))-methyltransferase RlmK/23S rRNA (guanine(2445)-N(2))-methyltransferase RlmL [Xanthomonadales bacterium]|nr:bifunctional 23S rRNA (guanine(2069)-N(7))-methyltransferase RlmK/23S rRNA (guanine(2445)-N(2))-methyltransferase RlmL [Xanthomonadales bacterium]
MRYFATCPRGLELLLADELRSLGAEQAREGLAGVHVEAADDFGLRACLWSRLASRVLLPLAQFQAADADALYRGVQSIDWDAHLAAEGSLAVDAVARASAIHQGMFAGQRVKDAIVDQLRARHGVRPSVDTEQPDVRINLRLVRDQAVVSLDLSGSPLHQRGWRQGQGEAPLKENLAAALLLRAGWPSLAAQGGVLFDPFCGVGTVVIEAAWMAADIAPGLLRPLPGCARWRGFEAARWQALRDDALQRRDTGLAACRARLSGSDRDPAVVALARDHARTAGVERLVDFETADALTREPPRPAPTLIASNLPYGARLGDAATTAALYRGLGQRLRESYPDSAAAFLTLADGRGKALGLRARKRYALRNGALECQLLLIDPPAAATGQGVSKGEETALTAGAQMVANRLAKNLRHLRRRLEREGISCYRLYDADLPEYAAAIDIYEGHAVIQEYQAPAEVPEATARTRLGELVRATRHVLALSRDRVVVKTRRRQSRDDQYRALAGEGDALVVQEGGLRFEVRLRDYLDTGLYLDHRLVRRWLGANARGTDFLNLFCYTGAATVHAAAGGARSTTSVDLSATYLDWARRNLELNGFTGRGHRLVQADVMRWLAARPGRFDLIYVDPPTFSNSKRAEDFDVQRQHVALLDACRGLLAPGGRILFSNHFRRFRLEEASLAPKFQILDMGAEMLPFDFARDPRIHQVYLLRPRDPEPERG